MPVGTMLRWHDEKGFGFVCPEDGGEDLFCHVSALLDGEGSVMEGDKVRFRITFDERKGKDRAVDVEVSGGGGGGGRDRSRSRGRGGGGYGGHGGGDSYGKGGGKGGDIRPGDWECPECGANVFGSKSECFKCGAPKNSGRGGGRGRDRDYDDRGRDRDYDDRGR